MAQGTITSIALCMARVALTALTFVAVGCAGMPPPTVPYKAYEGEERPREELATLNWRLARLDYIQDSSGHRYFEVSRADTDYAHPPAELLPGQHTVRFSYWTTRRYGVLAPTARTGSKYGGALVFEAEAGHEYLLDAKSKGFFSETLYPYVKDLSTGKIAVSTYPPDILESAKKGKKEAQYVAALFPSNTTQQSRRWLCLAANQGFGPAQYGKARSYLRSGNLIKAYMWMALASESGYSNPYYLYSITMLQYHSDEYAFPVVSDFTDVQNLRDDISAHMTTDQLAEAKRLVAEWEPNPAECEREAQADN